MKKLVITLMVLVLWGCTETKESAHPVHESKKLIVGVFDYSKSYAKLITIDTPQVQSLVYSMAKGGGSLVHIGIQNNSNRAVYLTRIDRLDTVNTATNNLYQQARQDVQNSKKITDFDMSAHQQVCSFMQEVHKHEASSYTALQHSLDLAKSTVCEPVYADNAQYKRYVLILSDMWNDPPRSCKRHLVPIDMCGATVLIVRPSPLISEDSLRGIFPNTQVHTFTTINDAILFLDQQ